VREAVGRDEIRAKLPYRLSPESCTTLLEAMVDEGSLETRGGGYRPPGEGPALSPAHEEALAALNEFMEAGAPLRGREEVDQLLSGYPEGETMLKYALSRGILVMLPEKVVARAEFVASMQDELVAYLKKHETVRAADYKDMYNVSRKQATALLDYYYEQGVTVREGGTHRLSPRHLKDR
jgi:hypothetical protein